MEDAYEIGIRLVLENGVSAGIAALQNDLAAYDRALAVTTGRLRTMTEAGHELAAPASAATVGPAAHGLARVENMPPPDVEPSRRQEAPAPPPALLPPVFLPLPAITAPAPLPPPVFLPLPAIAAPAPLPPPVFSPPPAIAVPAATAPLPVFKPAPVVMALVPVLPRQPVARNVAGNVAGPREGEARLAAAPESPVRAVASLRQGTPSPERGLANAALTVSAVPPPRYANYAPALPGSPPPVLVAPDLPEMPDGRPAPMPTPDRRDRQQLPLAVRELFVPSAWGAAPPEVLQSVQAAAQAPTRPANAPAALALPAAPVAPAAGPTQGDVFLDGTRVGRWMSNRLAQEAGRPQAGVTGFDPRLGPAWPGSLHGT